MNTKRLEQVLDAMEKNYIYQMIVSDPASIFYLTGEWIHPGERLLSLYINLDKQYKLFINELFSTKDHENLEKIIFKDIDDGVEIISKHIDSSKVIGIDKNWPARFLLRLMELNKESKFVNSSVIIDKIRMCKDKEEKDLMRKASKINDEAMDEIIKHILPSHTEEEMGEILKNIYKNLGAEGFSFDPIIAYGANGADPHHELDASTLKEGDSIIIDIGCKYKSYCSDMTRTLFYKDASEEAKKVYNIVLEANKRAIEIIKPGVRFCDIDAKAREYIESCGYGKYFTHRTGHSIGIETHDLGDVSSVNTQEVKLGMIFSVEPGIYLPGKFGVRIEDLVLVTEDGHERLNTYDKELRIIK